MFIFNALRRPLMDNRLLSPEERAEKVVSQMTMQEKMSWLSGPMAIPMQGKEKIPGALGSAAYYPAIERLGIPAQQQSDASLGVGNLGNVRPGDNATALPSSLILGASFDPELAEETGRMLGNEAHSKGFNVQLAGGANLIREARGGRNFEYISEDPLLTGIIAGYSVKGIQSQHVVSTLKHFALNAQETGRVLISADIDEQALQESDLLAFKIAIEQGDPGAIMPGYNLVNGDWASENEYLLNQVLKKEWGFKGWAMSDWGATHSTVKAALAGLDVQSGNNLDAEPYFAQPLEQAVNKGEVPMARIDDMVKRQLTSLFAVGAIDHPATPGKPIDYSRHKLIAQKAAENGIVLLKNHDNLLPLKMNLNKILVIGGQADKGVLAGGGSSSVTPVGSHIIDGAAMIGVPVPKVYHPSSPLHAIRCESGAASVTFLDGSDKAAVRREAQEADAVILFVESWRSEGQDLTSLTLDNNQDSLIETAAGANANTVVVIESGGAVKMPWLEQVGGVLAAFYPGCGGGEAIAGLLFGRVNPSGRLPVTFPRDEAQLPRPVQKDPATTTSNPGEPFKGEVFHEDYNIEGADVGYRWFDKQQIQPLFPFGYGLSYTQFEVSGLQLAQHDQVLQAGFSVKNSGDRAGAYVAQIYARRADDAECCWRLVGFKKVFLAPGEQQQLSLRLESRLLASFNLLTRRWDLSAGNYRFKLADDAGDEGMQQDFPLQGFSAAV
jgi:beta-glucosidase